MNILIDSGADVSLMSIDGLQFEASQAHGLKGIGGSQISGPPMITDIVFNSLPGKSFTCNVRPVNIKGEPNLLLLGKDFMSGFDCTIFDWKNNKIKLGENWVYLNTPDPGVSSSRIFHFKINDSLSFEQRQRLTGILDNHSSVFAHNPKCPRACHTTEHVIYTKDDRVVKDKIRPLPRKWREQMLNQAKEMLENKIIRPSCSPHNSNVLPAEKKDKTMRFCIDFRTLNKATIADSYPLPNVNEMLDEFHGSEYFTQLDLASGYWGVPLREEDKCKTAFSLEKAKYEFERMPFGLVNAQATFQRSMDSVVHTVRQRGHNGVNAYVDNVIIHHKSFEDHMAAVRETLQVINEHNFSLRENKCEFAYHEMEFLGYVISKNGIKASPDNVEKICRFPTPSNRKEVQRFLGLTNFNRRFISHYSETTAPLAALTSCKVQFKWDSLEDKAFKKSKNA